MYKRQALASAELRVPLFGTRDLGLINLPFLPTELALFTDAGLAWDKGSTIEWAFERDPYARIAADVDPNNPAQLLVDRRFPVVSVGASARVNVLGYIIAEVFYAYPFQRPDRGAHFGLNLQPGW